MVNVIPSKNLMPSTKYATNYEKMSYSSHFLKSRGSIIRINFREYRTEQVTFLSDETFFIHYTLQIKQNIYSICIFRAIVVTQFIVNV